ncbi:MAG: pitrilysin family protein, partial [Bacilli bacterium]
MILKTYNCNSFNVHTVKTDKFKTCHMEIIFRKDILKEDMSTYSFLCDILTDCSKKYPQKKDVIIRLEELYKAVLYGLCSRLGNTLFTSFVYEFIEPTYINDDNYLEDVIKFPFSMIQEPLVTNEEFDQKTFNIIKKRYINEIKSIEDDGYKLSLKKLFNTLEDTSPTSYSTFGSVTDLEKITPASLYKVYKSFYKDNICDIFIIGNLDMDLVVTHIKKYFKNRVINNKKIDLFVENKVKNKCSVVHDKANFVQTHVNVIYNLVGFTKYERDIVFNLYNYILCSGGLTSKLYLDIREKNSLCYSIDSMYLKFDNLFLLHLSLDDENKEKAIKLIKKGVKEMALGDFTETDIENAKRSIRMSLDLSLDNIVAILNNCAFNYFDDLPLLEERKKLLMDVTKEDIVNVAKKLKINTAFMLSGGEE